MTGSRSSQSLAALDELLESRLSKSVRKMANLGAVNTSYRPEAWRPPATNIIPAQKPSRIFCRRSTAPMWTKCKKCHAL